MINKAAGKGAEAGFSLVELMIVVTIIGILATVAIPAYFNHISRAHQSNAINEMMAIRASQEMYFSENEGSFADKIGLLPMYEGVGTFPGAVYEDEFYEYNIIEKVPGSGDFDTIEARGDLNKDGDHTDKWRLPVDDLTAKPALQPGSNEGFSWSTLGDIF